MRSIEWLCCRWPWVTHNHLKLPEFLQFALPFVIGDCKDFKFDVQIERASHSLRKTNRSS